MIAPPAMATRLQRQTVSSKKEQPTKHNSKFESPQSTEKKWERERESEAYKTMAKESPILFHVRWIIVKVLHI